MINGGKNHEILLGDVIAYTSGGNTSDADKRAKDHVINDNHPTQHIHICRMKGREVKTRKMRVNISPEPFGIGKE